MRRRRTVNFCVGVERLHPKLLLSASHSPTQVASPDSVSGSAAFQVADVSGPSGGSDQSTGGSSLAHPDHRRLPPIPNAFLVHRITAPTGQPVNLTPPFLQDLVQAKQPVPGQVYNVLYIAVRNGTAQTFTAANNFTVTFPGVPHVFPVLTGTEEWKPRRWIVFYVLTKQYYPLHSQISGGFELFLPGRKSTLVPGPSGIFLRLRYNPTTFARTLDWIVAFGQGAQLSIGPKTGIADTAINNAVAGRTHKIDFGGHF
jgi:hypothetical protein